MTLPFVSRECWNSPRNIRNPLPLGPRPPPRGRFQGGDLPVAPLGHHFTPFRGTLHPSPPLFNPHRSLFLPRGPPATRVTRGHTPCAPRTRGGDSGRDRGRRAARPTKGRDMADTSNG